MTTQPTLTPAELRPLWDCLLIDWLYTPTAPDRSAHTRRAYAKAADLWLAYLAQRGVEPWAVTAAHVRDWQTHLIAAGHTAATVNARLSAVSSWYAYIISVTPYVDGVPCSAFPDARGLARANPFRSDNLSRPRVRPYDRARPLATADLIRLFAYLADHAHTLTGARNHALLLTYFLTASRSHAVLEMRLADLRPSRAQPDTLIWLRPGRGDKPHPIPLPARAHHAIVHYLTLAGRHLGDPDPADDFLWPPLVTHGCANLTGAGPRTPRAFISPHNALRILHTALRRAGVPNWRQYRLADLRHSFAHLYHGDLDMLRRLLDYTTRAAAASYVAALRDPTDDYSDAVWQSLTLSK